MSDREKERWTSEREMMKLFFQGIERQREIELFGIGVKSENVIIFVVVIKQRRRWYVNFFIYLKKYMLNFKFFHWMVVCLFDLLHKMRAREDLCSWYQSNFFCNLFPSFARRHPSSPFIIIIIIIDPYPVYDHSNR